MIGYVSVSQRNEFRYDLLATWSKRETKRIVTSFINNEINSGYKNVGVTEKSVPGHKCPRPRYIFVKKKSVPGRECPRHFARTIVRAKCLGHSRSGTLFFLTKI